jgi:hypothetical protein
VRETFEKYSDPDPAQEEINKSWAEHISDYKPAYTFGNDRDAKIIARSSGKSPPELPHVNISKTFEQLFLHVEPRAIGRGTRREKSGIQYGGHTYDIVHSISNGRLHLSEERVERYMITDHDGEEINHYVYEPITKKLFHNGFEVNDDDESSFALFHNLLSDVMIAKKAQDEAS